MGKPRVTKDYNCPPPDDGTPKPELLLGDLTEALKDIELWLHGVRVHLATADQELVVPGYPVQPADEDTSED